MSNKLQQNQGDSEGETYHMRNFITEVAKRIDDPVLKLMISSSPREFGTRLGFLILVIHGASEKRGDCPIINLARAVSLLPNWEEKERCFLLLRILAKTGFIERVEDRAVKFREGEKSRIADVARVLQSSELDLLRFSEDVKTTEPIEDNARLALDNIFAE